MSLALSGVGSVLSTDSSELGKLSVSNVPLLCELSSWLLTCRHVSPDANLCLFDPIFTDHQAFLSFSPSFSSMSLYWLIFVVVVVLW